MWFVYAVLGALGKSYSGFFRKKMVWDVSASMFMWISYSLIIIVLLPYVALNFSEITKMFQSALLVIFGGALAMNIATLMNLEALKREDLSYVAPLNAFVPVFTLIIAAVFLGESPPTAGLFGLIAVALGAYFVNLESNRVNWYDPIVRLATSRGAQLSVGVALAYAINTVFMKELSNQAYNGVSILFSITLVGWLLLVHVPITKTKELRKISKSSQGYLLGAATSSFAGSYFHILAIAGTYASYAVGIRRFEMLFSVLLGWRYLKETNIRNKLIGCFFMIAGSIIMILA